MTRSAAEGETPPSALVEPAPAKVNLDLLVTGRRADGYHELDSLVVFAPFGDRLTVAPAASLDFTAHGPFADSLPPGALEGYALPEGDGTPRNRAGSG